MKRKVYTSLQDIKLDLQSLDLQRQIQIEELKLTKHQFKEDLSLSNWMETLLRLVKKYGIVILLKKIIKNRSRN